MKVVNLLLTIIALNIFYWGFSEVYFYEGKFYIGMLRGAIVSAFCVGLPILVFIIIKIKKGGIT
jgi:hypothetical protein